MNRKICRETLEGAVRLDGWLASKPKPVIPQVVSPNDAEWLLGTDELAKSIKGAIVLINIGLTALPEDLQEQIADLASRQDLVVWVHIRTADNQVITREFIRQVSDSRMEKYIATIPGLAEAIEALA